MSEPVVVADDAYYKKWAADKLLRCREVLNYDVCGLNPVTYKFVFWKEKNHLLTLPLRNMGNMLRLRKGMLYAGVPEQVLQIYRNHILPALDTESIRIIKEAVELTPLIKKDYGLMQGIGELGYFVTLVYLFYSIKKGLSLVEFSFLSGHAFPWRFHTPFTFCWCNSRSADITSTFVLPVECCGMLLSEKPVLLTNLSGFKINMSHTTVQGLMSWIELREDQLQCVGVIAPGNYYAYYKDDDTVKENPSYHVV